MPDPSRYPRLALLGLALAGCAAAGVAAWWYYLRPEPPAGGSGDEVFTPDPPTPDPRLVFDTPFRNVKPDVQYIGDAACGRCHPGITKSYHAHPMGRSAAAVPRSEPIEKYPADGHAAFRSGPFDLEAEKTPGGVRHHVRLRGESPVPVPELVLPADVAIGSGTRGRSYLAVEGGAVWQTAVSWFGPDQRWDLSPGFHLGKAARRAIIPACLYCHVDQVRPVPGAENRYREPVFAAQLSIGCERCHGPGQLHAAERAGGAVVEGVDTSIVNPRHLAPALQAAVCEQCHLQGEERVNRRGRDAFEFRPGLPFEQFVSVHVRHPALAAAHRSVGQFEQMEQSRCFVRSSGALQCTSCHDPHASPEPEAKEAHYRKRCLTCHESRGCSAPPPDRQARGDSCTACHMPKSASSNIIHASVTDHRVPRRPADRPARETLPFGAPPLVRFRSGPLSPPAEEQARDLGVALARFSRKPAAKELAGGDPRPLAAERLKASLARWPGDADAWVALAGVRTERGEVREKLRAAKAAAALAPASEAALAALAEAASAAGEYDLAVRAADDWLRLNPKGFDPLAARAFVHLSRGDWAGAEADARAALRLQPLNPEVRLYLAIALHRRGDAAAGLAEARTAEQLEADPRERELLKERYRGATR